MRRCGSCRIGAERLKARIVTSQIQQFAVLGSPISHSQSPALHRAAYGVLGLDWEYSAREVRSGELANFFSCAGSDWRGLSLTMPLKREILPFLDEQDAVSTLVGAANTVLFDNGKMRGFNTDVYGAERMLREALPDIVQRPLILGGGATAASLAASFANMGVSEIVVAVRSTASTEELLSLGGRLGVAMTVTGVDAVPVDVDAVVSTLPGAAELAVTLPARLRETVPLVDIAYAPWPTVVARQWRDAGGAIAGNGLGMLIYQALAQLRIFVGGDAAWELPHEVEVLAAMRAAVNAAT